MTPFEPDNLGLTDAGLPLLRDLVHERTGLFYENGRCESLGERLAPLVIEHGFHSYLDFYYLLKFDEGAEAEWRRVMDALSVQETYFWREVDQMHAVADQLLPDLLKAHRGPVRIWSAPCASGEEPLTLAMILNEAGWFERADIELHASDGSATAVAKAREGRYRGRAFRALPPAMRDKYFIPLTDQEGWRPVRELTEKVRSWSVVNLMDQVGVEPFVHSDVIFCRNAFIYFSADSIRRAVATFAEKMPSPGYLFVGAAESLLSVTDRFVLRELGRAFVYVKR